jgi:thiol:disulfide interchange protein DsbG
MTARVFLSEFSRMSPMKKTFFASMLAAGFLLMGTSAHAQAADTAAVQKVPPALQLAVQGGLKVERSFSAAGGLTGWVLSEGAGRNMVVYTSADGEVAIAGNMVDAKGTNLTAKYLDQYGTKIDHSKFWSKLEQSTFIAEGAQGKDVKNVIYAFEDANCGYCHQMWKAVQPFEKAGLQVRWIPVAFLAKDSANKAAGVLAAKNPAAAMATMHAEWGQQAKPGDPKDAMGNLSSFATTSVTPEMKAKLDANAKLMAEMGFRGTPATLYKDKSGKVLAADGMPKPAMFSVITGITLPAGSEK